MTTGDDDARVETLEGEWRELVALGPRFHGTPGASDAAWLIEARLLKSGIVASRQEFSCKNWRLEGPVALEITEPIKTRIACEAMLLSEGLSAGGWVSGRIRFLGGALLWAGLYAWKKVALVGDSGAPVAYICARPDGLAIPQLVPEGSSAVPHVCIGAGDFAFLEQLCLATGSGVQAKISMAVERSGRARGMNIIGTLVGERHAGRILVCAHYDSMWNTPGAYDNASGVCVLLEVARRLHARPASRPVDVVFFGAEEWNLAGSRAYVSALVDKGGLGEIDCVLVLDGFGRGSVLDVWVGPEAFEWEIARACASYASGRSVSIRFTSPPLPGSDHVPFWEEGTPAAMLTFNDQDVIHSSSDVPNEGSLANMVYAVGLVEYLVRHICLDWREDSSGIDG